ncbi:hypothetical protein M406DRAFT_354054 [Cryphonectria parasitica EP155]|uniref:Uncharacterized protein n=1 Tax=Cryphonectria parasitica (strain ATCC 38755 / EP155) TaxID=660469 RepID=A0A9P5CSS2_CRYP1|nr:uncharacterized protein M406DRAFT_354054 [Cryphonectria parasitica EP155]KAF3769578.1 hypothetical protein M406DRAFT_354054 [Cryphonectria parasitica EP155]
MIRRVQEEKELVCRDLMEFEEKEEQNKLERWMKQAQMKLKRLEEDAQRVRKSLVTLLDLRQRQVNAEGVVNSELQSKIFVVFTAATVVFTPLSWISSLMALDIVDFSPPDSQPWSRNQALAASLVTMAASVVLILLCLLGWRWYEKISSSVQHEDPSTIYGSSRLWKRALRSIGRRKEKDAVIRPHS